ncbi:MAG TPA: DUF4386 domain-containing protein [Candidatus Udaeobacter sp.]|jgi:hypothetical protein|nr:DUF4386 domain-containing protein [Candidatus Udaeobacter sp.]
MNTIDKSQQLAARIAGASGLVAVVIVVFGNYALLGPLIIAGDAVNTARNIVTHQTQLRLALTSFVLYGASVVVLLSALYVVLKPVNTLLAILAALFRLVFVLLWLTTPLNLLSALRLLGNTTYLQAFESDRLQALARLHIGASFDDYYVGLPFFALAATVCGCLWFKSRYIPRPLAAFGIAASAWCVVCAFVFLIFPGFDKAVNAYWFDSPMAIFELIVSVWLLLKGIGASPLTSPDRIGSRSTTPVSLRLPMFL